MKQVKVRLTTSLAGAVMHPAGSILETSTWEAHNLVAAGFAVYIDEPTASSQKAAPKKEKPVEEATSVEFVKRETTAKRTTRRKRK